jgi:hypothetical protein
MMETAPSPFGNNRKTLSTTLEAENEEDDPFSHHASFSSNQKNGSDMIIDEANCDDSDAFSTGSNYTDSNFNNNKKKAPKEELSQREDKAIFCLRLAVLLILMSALVGVSWSGYRYLDHGEQTAFEENYNSDAAKLLDSMGASLDNTLGPMDALIVNVLAHARAVRQQQEQQRENENTTRSFPFVTLPSFGLQAAKLLRISKGFQLQIGMKVNLDQAEDWRQYAAAHHKDWIEDALDIMEGDPDWKGIVPRNYNACPDIYSWGGVPQREPVEKLGFYNVNWMEYPVMSGASGNGGCPYNFDLTNVEEYILGVQAMMYYQRVIIGNFPIVNFPDEDPRKKIMGDFVRQFVPPDVDPFEPFTQIVVPIFQTIVQSVYVNTTQPQKYVALMNLSIQLRALIENILSEQSEGVMMVVDQGECGTCLILNCFLVLLGESVIWIVTMGKFTHFLVACCGYL